MARVGAARVFFDIVGTFQAKSLLGETEAAMTVQQAIILDALGGITEAFDETSQFIIESTKQVVEAFHEYEAQLIRVRKFYSGEASEVNRFTEASIRLGESFAFTGAEALAASARTAQLKGVLESQEAIIEATRAGLLMAQVGEMETELGMNRFIALAQQTGFMYGGLTKATYDAMSAEQQANIVRGNSIRVLDQLNTIENTSVATMEDITFVLNQFASQADIAGESIGDMAAMSALLLETGEEVSRAGTGLRMIYQRIGNENSDAVKVLQELMGGVEASAITQMKLTDIIQSIGPAYAEMTGEQKRNLAVSIAGSRHYVKFLKLMENQPRLLELQTNAYRGQYGAIEEFELKAESLMFQQIQHEAVIKNLQVEIGDKLASAYMSGVKAQEVFLSSINKGLENEKIRDFVENAIQLSQIYKTMAAPLANVAMQAFNLIIAFKTLAAVNNALKPQAYAAAEGYRKTRQEMKFLNTTTLEYGALSKGALFGAATAHRQAKAEVFTHTFAVEMLNDHVKVQETNLYHAAVANNAFKRAMREATHVQGLFVHKLIESSGYVDLNDKGMALITAKHKEFTAALQQAQAALANQNVKLAVYKNILLESGMATNQLRAFQAQGVAGLANRYKAQVQLNATLDHENALLGETLILSRALIPAEKERLNAEIQSNAMKIQGNRARMAAINTTLLLGTATDEVKQALMEELTALRNDTNAHMERNNQIRMGLLASEQAEQAAREFAIAQHQATLATKAFSVAAVGAAMKTAVLGMSVKSVMNALLPMTMILPFIVDNENQMAAAGASLSVMMMTMLLPSLQTIGAQMKANGVAATFMTGGLNIAAAAIITFAAYMGFKKFGPDSDFLSGAVANVEDFNQGVLTSNQLLSTLSESDEAVYAGLVDKSFSELAQGGTAEINSALSVLRGELAEITLALDSTAEGTSLFNEMMADQSALENAITQVEALGQAYKNQERLARLIASGEDYDVRIRETISYASENAKILGIGDKKYAVEYMDLQGKMHRFTYQSREEAEAKQREIQDKYNTESLLAQQAYNDTFIRELERRNDDVLNTEKTAQEVMLGDAYAFANAREELFFGGNKAGFTGTLMKQVMQGGVENLLYKTEIVQTNVFNGMTLPEMVEQVSAGVIAELGNRGVLS